MSSKLTFINTNELPRVPTNEGGEVTIVLNEKLQGAKNVLGTLRWLKPGEQFTAQPRDKHQLVYLMEGSGIINLENKDYPVPKGSGVYLGPNETATIKASGGDTVKLFHLIVPQIPK